MRSLIGGNANPNASCSASNQAAPRPNIARPPEMHVERRRGLGEQRRVAVRDAGDERPEPDPGRLAGERGEGGPRLEHRLVWTPDARDLVEVVHDSDEAEAGGLGGLGLLDDAVEQPLGRRMWEVVQGQWRPNQTLMRPACPRSGRVALRPRVSRVAASFGSTAIDAPIIASSSSVPPRIQGTTSSNGTNPIDSIERPAHR